MTLDASNRIIAPDQHEPQPRPDGPWTSNAAPFTFVSDGRTFICAWHAGHNAQHPLNQQNPNHGLCPACAADMEREA